MCQLFETISLRDGVLENIAYHQHRFEKSYMELWGKIPELNLSEYIRPQQEEGHYKARFIYNRDCFKVEYSIYTPRKIRSFKVVHTQGLDYHLKYLDRSAIDDLCAMGDCDDILIVNDSLITDTSIANIYFFDGKQWLTPSKPLLYGTSRARLIEEMDIKECDITIEQLCKFSRTAVSNAMMGFCELEGVVFR